MNDQTGVDQSQDPVEVIKKAEADALLKSEEFKKEADKDLQKIEEDLKEDRREFEEGLKAKGTEKLKKTKLEASELLKSRMTQAQQEANQTINRGGEKLQEAVQIIEKVFFTYLKQ